MPEIDHAEVRFILDPKASIPSDVERENKTMDWAEGLYKQSMLIAAAGVLVSQGSLEKVASVLWWAGFRVPYGYFPDDEGESLDRDDEEALRLWVEREAESIEGAVRTVGLYLAGRGMLLDDAKSSVTDWGE
jgi:hypothetical protein